jgi:DNA-binding transcriptional regulator GbsR (MarR family)
VDTEALRQFVEDAGDMIEEHGLPHMAGRVIGALLACEPPHRSLDELAEELSASKGAISMATQLLIRLALIERVSVLGERRHYYQIGHDVWSTLFVQSEEEFGRHRRVAERGLRLLQNEPIEAKRRLLDLLVFLDFVAEEAPGFAERWKRRKGALLERRMREHA